MEAPQLPRTQPLEPQFRSLQNVFFYLVVGSKKESSHDNNTPINLHIHSSCNQLAIHLLFISLYFSLLKSFLYIYLNCFIMQQKQFFRSYLLFLQVFYTGSPTSKFFLKKFLKTLHWTFY